MSDSSGKPQSTPAAGLTDRQRRVLEVIRASVSERGYPPSIREIGDAVGLTSTSSVAHQLARWNGRATCDATPTGRAPWTSAGWTTACAARHRGAASTRVEVTGSTPLPKPTFVPVLGRIAAGGPILAEEAVEDVFPLPASSSARDRCSCSRSSANR